MKKWSGLAAVAACLMTLVGCTKPLDGPGMVNDRPWREFTLTRSDSFAQYNFWFTVQVTDTGYLLTGQCRDEDGNEYVQESGVPLSEGDGQYLRELWLGELPDAAVEDDDLILMDAPTVRLFLTMIDGTQQEKCLSDDISIEIYHRFLPYLKG